MRFPIPGSRFPILMLLIPQIAVAQSYSGTWSIPAGNTAIMLTLRQTGAQVTGTLAGNANFTIQARVNGQMFEGLATNAQGRIYIAGQLQGADALTVVMGEVDANGTPQQQTMRSFVASRGGQAPGVSAGGGRGAGEGSTNAGNSAIAPTAGDRQVAQLLLRSPWCFFSYSQTSGTTRTERNVYRADGTGSQTGGAETYNSGANGTVSGQSSSGTQFRWRIQNQMLLVSLDGASWSQPIPLNVTQNSNGYPIITANGREYSMCN